MPDMISLFTLSDTYLDYYVLTYLNSVYYIAGAEMGE